jgi:hypothetical protein
MWTITVKSITISILVAVAWFFGFQELWGIFSDFSDQWYWFVLATVWTTTLNDVFGHMILTHRLFAVDTKSIAYRIFSFLFIVDHGWGPVTGFCMAHHRHHQCSDQGNKDVANWRTGWWAHGIVSPINYIFQPVTDWGDADRYVDMQERKFDEIFDDTWTWLIEEYSHILTIVFWILLYFVCPTMLFKIVFLGRALLTIYTLFSTIGGHTKLPGGYRNFNTPDHSYNNLLLHYTSLLMFPTILQNNHHGQKYTLEKGSGLHWYEFDISKYIARFLKLMIEKKD